jgi:hypothetical protein
MSSNQGNEPGVDYQVQARKGSQSTSSNLVVTRASQPMGFKDTLNARVPGFEDITDQPDWGDNGFSGRKSDLRLVRFDRLPRASQEEQDEEQGRVDTDA